MGSTKIEWATHTANWLAGCTKVSQACTHCYAEVMSGRQVAMGTARYEGVVDKPGPKGRWTGRINYDHEAMNRAFRGLYNCRNPRRVFVNSMSDTFHANVPPESMTDLAEQIRAFEEHREWAILASPTQERVIMGHVIMLLTKRPDRLLEWQREHFPDGLPSWVWVGCTVENQERADERVPVLLNVATEGVRFLSCEPLLGEVDIASHLGHAEYYWRGALGPCGCDEHRIPWDRCDACIDAGWEPAAYAGIQWVIAGGESGRNARPMHPDWARSLRDQCQAAGVAFHFKQWGEWCMRGPASMSPNYAPVEGARCRRIDDVWLQRVGKHAAGRLLDGRTWDEVP